MKIIVYGAGYVGLANALSLAHENDVTITDIKDEIVNLLKSKKIHIDDKEAEKEIKKSKLKSFYYKDINVNDYDVAILALPTNFSERTKKFSTNFLDKQLEIFQKNNYDKEILIKSTIPLGYTAESIAKYKLNIVFSPEFLREGSSYQDTRNPDRIILDENMSKLLKSELIKTAKNSPKIIEMKNIEAEAVKLFANTYLAMRVSFVNELSTFAISNDLNENKIIKGVGSDRRIGNHYFTPSFGYGGYCLPKDSKQLSSEFLRNKIETFLMPAIILSNESRKIFIANQLINKTSGEIEIKGIAHKGNVKNFRNSPKLDVAKIIRAKGYAVKVIDKNFSGQIIEDFKIYDK